MPVLAAILFSAWYGALGPGLFITVCRTRQATGPYHPMRPIKTVLLYRC